MQGLSASMFQAKVVAMQLQEENSFIGNELVTVVFYCA